MRVCPTEVAAAADRLAGRVRLTPVIDADVNGVAVALKLELLQHTGSFKPRGAFNRVLSETTSPRRLVAASGGNHGLAVAHVARELDGQAPHLDTVLVAVGGGGLIAGVCAWFDGRVRVVAVIVCGANTDPATVTDPP